jgi:hypothetical protein
VTATPVVGNAHSSSHSSSKNAHAHWPSELYADFTSRVWITYWHIAPTSTYPGLVTYCLRARIGRILHSFDGRGPKSRSPPVLHRDVGGRVATTAMRIEGCRLGLHALNWTIVALDGPTPGTRCVRFFPNTIPCPDLAVDWQLPISGGNGHIAIVVKFEHAVAYIHSASEMPASSNGNASRSVSTADSVICRHLCDSTVRPEPWPGSVWS